MKPKSFAALALAVSMSALGQTTPPPKQTAPAQDVTGVAVYPGKGQSAQQQEKDKLACSSWATQQTGVDPSNVTVAKSGTSGSKGAARGGLVGTGVGLITGNPLAGAAVGAGTGAVVGHNRKKSNEGAQVKQQLDAYSASYSACLDGKGYSTRRTGQ